VASVTGNPAVAAGSAIVDHHAAKAARDSVLVVLGGQVERALGLFTTFALRWGLDPARLGVYTGLRLYLDNTNRSSLGVGLGAVQEIPALRAAGRHDEAARVANVAHTANTITCGLYVAGLIAWAVIRLPLLRGDSLAAEWTWGLIAVAALAIVQRYLSFLIAVLRSHQEFGITTSVDIVEAVASAVLIVSGVWIAGLWGVLAAVGGVFAIKIGYLHVKSPLRFRWVWDGPLVWRLMRSGLPILANTAVFGAVLNLDRVLILWRVPDGERAVGLYSVALLGTSWGLDVAGRVVTVLYPYFQVALSHARDRAEVPRRALQATEAQAALLAALAAWAYLVGPAALGMLLPRYAEGLPALRPLLPGMFLLGLAWPSRQMLIAVGRPYRLCAGTLAALPIAIGLGILGADRAGIVGVAWAMSAGYAIVFLITSATATVPDLGFGAWLAHLGRLAIPALWFALGAAGVDLLIPISSDWQIWIPRIVSLAVWTLLAVYAWMRRRPRHGLISSRTESC
jgi:O-antigen/teichoic acid export membrane protein